ncbi:MAG: ribonuclease III [Alphaproteobacteria bacterium]|nr:ribonuclease III [Alphaproteobacteria bacterium]
MSDDLARGLGYSFQNASLLEQALTHPSAAKVPGVHYERLEFLGDAVLGLVMAEFLYRTYPGESEGDIAKRHALLVAGTTVSAVARQLDLAHHLRTSETEHLNAGRSLTSALEDACEALLGAVYLDGGFDAAKEVVLRLWDGKAAESGLPPRDAKSTLQEWSQGKGIGLPEYVTIKSEGPSHAPVFHVEVRVKGEEPVEASGPSKKLAEHEAARKILEKLGISL